MPDVLDAVESGEVDLGFVAIENSIEGTVNLTQDELAFNHDLLIQREVVLDIEHCLLGHPGTTLERREDRCCRSRSPPRSATPTCAGTCRRPRSRAANSTAEAARLVSEDRSGGLAAIAPRASRPSCTAWTSSPPTSPTTPATRPGSCSSPSTASRRRTGHDRTALVIYQRADEPGSLISILQEFAARRINLSNLLSRPTKDGGLGDYCFIVYADGHIADELARRCDARRCTPSRDGEVPRLVPGRGRARPHRPRARRRRWREADDWINELRRKITPS